MNIEEFRDYCMSKAGVTEEFPFDENTLVFKVMGKMFALTGLELFESINLKCDPELALELREEYHAVKPGYHMSKKHWNTVTNGADAPDQKIYEWIDDSYELVVKSLTKKLKEELKNL
ncbi:MAG: MmcQ/YjbR family DNA-binding protein [Flavobacteriales bacterium]|nr:MmcQ/YjbR family DNA-binding protein [Flavobacteriales bacterium]